jgi:hypothetical protein
MISLPNVMKLYELAEKGFSVGTRGQTDGELGDLISLRFIFEGSRPVMRASRIT